MAKPKSAPTVRRPKSLAHALKLLSGLMDHVDPLNGVFHPGRPAISVSTQELSPILVKRLRESGIVVIEDREDGYSVIRRVTFEDARQLDLFGNPVPVLRPQHNPLTVYGPQCEKEKTAKVLPGGLVMCQPSLFSAAAVEARGEALEAWDAVAQQEGETAPSQCACQTEAPAGGS